MPAREMTCILRASSTRERHGTWSDPGHSEPSAHEHGVMRQDGRVTGRRVGDRDGFGRFGVVDETADGLLCHECGRRFIHLGLHVYKAHGVTANEYRVAHGLRRRGLVVAPTAEVIAENARRTLSAKAAFSRARDPTAASQAQRRGPDAISPAGIAAIREASAARRGSGRKGTVVTCGWCRVQFCPLLSATRRQFCSRSCAARNTRSLDRYRLR